MFGFRVITSPTCSKLLSMSDTAKLDKMEIVLKLSHLQLVVSSFLKETSNNSEHLNIEVKKALFVGPVNLIIIDEASGEKKDCLCINTESDVNTDGEEVGVTDG